MQDIQKNKDKKLGFWQIAKSTLSAALGVQSRKNLTDDFEHGKPTHYIISGIIFTLIFLLAVISLVKLLLS